MRRLCLALCLAMIAPIASVAVVGCSSCRRSEAVATIAETAGDIERDTKTTVGKWTGAAVHAELFVGDGVRSGAASKAVLELSDKSRLDLAEKTIIRFRDHAQGKKERIDLEMGEATLEVSGEGLSLETDVGLATIVPGSRISLKRTEKGVHYEVSVGLARFDSGGQVTEVAPGQGVTVGIGNATIERDPAAATTPSASAAPPTATPPTEAATAGGSIATHVEGTGASVRAPGETKFEKLSGDGSLKAGSTLRLAAGTSADVDRGGEHATLRGSGDFVVGESGQSFIQARGGGISFNGTAKETTVTVPGGSLVVKTGATADVHVKSDATQVAVKAGVVELHSESGTEALQAGEQGTLGAKGTTEVVGRGPGYIDFLTSAGASFAVHDPAPPTAIGFSSPQCPGGGVIELDKGRLRARGEGTVSVLVPPGGHKYELHCLEASGISTAVAASGSVTVIHDGGTARIPRTAPSTLVDTDGRNYTVLYQNILPKISVRWPKAPEGKAYTVTLVSPGGKSESHATTSPSYSFPSGSLREGVHRVSFEGGGKASKATTVDIRFDNAAPTATLTSPANGSFSQGSSVTVSGLALEGWKISAGGQELPLDGQLRFNGTVTAPGGQRALAVLFENPHRGVHYYLRRAGR